MWRKIGAGVMSGVLGGLALDALMRVFWIHAPDGSAISMIGYAGSALRPSDPWLGWIAYAFYGAVIGGVFGYVVSDPTLDARRCAFWGAVYGIGWWIVACAVFVPIQAHSFPFAVQARETLRQVAFPLFAGHVVYGAILGASWNWIVQVTSGCVAHQPPRPVAPR